METRAKNDSENEAKQRRKFNRMLDEWMLFSHFHHELQDVSAEKVSSDALSISPDWQDLVHIVDKEVASKKNTGKK